jgi:hypothetical protein
MYKYWQPRLITFQCKKVEIILLHIEIILHFCNILPQKLIKSVIM